MLWHLADPMADPSYLREVAKAGKLDAEVVKARQALEDARGAKPVSRDTPGFVDAVLAGGGKPAQSKSEAEQAAGEKLWLLREARETQEEILKAALTAARRRIRCAAVGDRDKVLRKLDAALEVLADALLEVRAMEAALWAMGYEGSDGPPFSGCGSGFFGFHGGHAEQILCEIENFRKHYGETGLLDGSVPRPQEGG